MFLQFSIWCPHKIFQELTDPKRRNKKGREKLYSYYSAFSIYISLLFTLLQCQLRLQDTYASLLSHMLQARQYFRTGAQMGRHYIKCSVYPFALHLTCLPFNDMRLRAGLTYSVRFRARSPIFFYSRMYFSSQILTACVWCEFSSF